jgi:hypothetical protein
MSISMKGRTALWCVVLAAGLACARLADAYTAPPTAPASSADGNYSVSWTSQCASDCVSQWLEEKVGGGAFTSVGYTSPTTYSGKPAGQYAYRLGRMVVTYYDPYYFSVGYAVEYSAEVVVNVGPVPTLDPLPTQRGYRYQTRVGDIDYDGRRDLYVQRIAGGVANNGVLDTLIVRQTATPGQYALLTPTAAQASVAASWPLAAAQVAVEDVNVDGFVDVVLKGVANALGVAGARDLIVYSPGQPYGTTPKGMRVVDDELLRFVGNMLDYEVDDTYFETHVSWTYVYYTYYWSTCSGGPVISGDPVFYYDSTGCISVYQTVYGYYPDYSAFASAAVAISTTVDKIENGSVSASAGIDDIDRTVEGVFKIGIGGWGMEEVLGGSGEHKDPNVRRALEVFWAILGIGRASAQEVQTVEAPKQLPRAPGAIYITGHHVFGVGPVHTAVEYTSSALPTTTLSAGPESTFLVSRVNRSSDLAALNMTLGTVSDPGNPVADSYFAELLAADANYGDDLPYSAVPVLPGVYNSNSYVRGLLDATGGVSTVDMNAFVGGNRPVPSSEFQ